MNNSYTEHKDLFYSLVPEGTPYLHPVGPSGCNNTLTMYLYCATMKEETQDAQVIFNKFMARVQEIIPDVIKLPSNIKCRGRLKAVADLFFAADMLFEEVSEPVDGALYLSEININPSMTRKEHSKGAISQVNPEEGSQYIKHMGLYSTEIGDVLFNKDNNLEFAGHTLYEIKQDLTVPQG